MGRLHVDQRSDGPIPHFELCFAPDDLPNASHVLQACGLDASGYDWQELVVHAIDLDAPMLQTIELDSEAELFCARSSNREALETLRENLCDLLRDRQRLRRLARRIAQRVST